MKGFDNVKAVSEITNSVSELDASERLEKAMYGVRTFRSEHIDKLLTKVPTPFTWRIFLNYNFIFNAWNFVEKM